MNKKEDIFVGAQFAWPSDPFDIATITKVDGDKAWFKCDSDGYTSDLDLNKDSGWYSWRPLNPKTDNAITPPHYNEDTIDALAVIDAWKLDFRLGNVVKYIQRHTKKGTPLQDLKKAAQYLALAIKKMEEQV